MGSPTGVSLNEGGTVREILLFPGQAVDLPPENEYTKSLLAERLIHLPSGAGSSPPEGTVSPDSPVDSPTPPTGDHTTDAVSPLVPEFWYVLPVSGQSNGMAYGEGMPLPDSLDMPHVRIKQLARRSTVTPGGAPCTYNEIIPLDHCPHDVQDMSGFNHPKADLSKGEYGCVSQAQHIARKLLPYIPANAGILVVPCCRGGSAFTQGADGTFSAASGATEASSRWGVGKPLYQDLISRTKAALDKNPKNVLLAVCWMQGEFDMAAGSYAQQPALFAAMVKQFRADLSDHAAQMPAFSPDNVPWICGDTTYYWKETYPTQYEAVYGAYKTCSEPQVYFVPFMTDEDGNNTPTNDPSQDPDIPAAHYFGSASRTSANWVSGTRPSHFSSWARRTIIPERFASAILLYASRKTLLAAPAGSLSPDTATSTPGTTTGGTLNYSPRVDEVGYNGRRGDGSFASQGWNTYTGAKFTAPANPDGKGGHVLSIAKISGSAWNIDRPVVSPLDLIKYGGRLTARFKLMTPLVNNQFAFAFYLPVPATDVPTAMNFAGQADGGMPAVMAFFIQTDATNINLMQHRKVNTKVGTFGAYNQDWHTLEIVFPGNNSVHVVPYLDGTAAPAFDLSYTPAASAINTLSLTGITKGDTYSLQISDFSIRIYRDDGVITLAETDASGYVYFPGGYKGGKVVLPDTPVSAGNTVQIVASNAGTITLQPASSDVLLNGLPSSSTTDHSVTLVQTGSDGKTWVTV
ncbi:sialate O-acetylesterase [Salmonella enterica subsp. enterica serovar Oslo]|nr:sialate O-acetylesterase [Salmonella enterica subsp. enterica serovar Oslo]